MPVVTQIYNITTNELNYHNGTTWKALGVAGAGISYLTAGTITTSGTIGIAVGGVTTTEYQRKSFTECRIERSKLASGTANHVLINDASGVMSSVLVLPPERGGTGLGTLTGYQYLGFAQERRVSIGHPRRGRQRLLGCRNSRTAASCTTQKAVLTTSVAFGDFNVFAHAPLHSHVILLFNDGTNESRFLSS